LYSLEDLDNADFSLDRAHDAEPTEPRLAEPRCMKDLTAWCKEVKRRSERNRAQRKARAGALTHWMLMNEVDDRPAGRG